MKATPLELNGLVLIELLVHKDARGFFTERFHAAKFEEFGLPTRFVQDNHSRSLPGVLRGLHFQHTPAQGKLIGVIHGHIWDVAVDLRRASPTLGRHSALELSGANGQLLWIPPGFAHGFCVLGDEPADVIYSVDSVYNPEGEGGIFWDDPELAIPWPVKNPIVSKKDQWLGAFATYKSLPTQWGEAVRQEA
jgi:dTDP-4-dehydrorhamnose 3,5-epimerase